MNISHHPPQDLLLAGAGGPADAPLALIAATHLAFCGTCRAAVAAVEGAARDQTAPGQISREGTPEPLRAFLDRDLSDVAWRRIGPGVAYLPLARHGMVRMRLLRGAPGTKAGVHSHRGMEYTQVLKGSFTDATGRYGPGDFQTASPQVSHNPVTDPGEDCITLSVTTAPLRFENLIQKVVAPLFGF